jgi:hypothetical protein
MLADLVLLVHAAFVVFVLAGGFLVRRWPKVVWLHAPAAIWGVAVEYAGFTCPLTPLETALRERAGEAGYRGGFIEHYVEGLLYPTGLTRELQIALGTCALIVNVVVYWHMFKRRRALVHE